MTDLRVTTTGGTDAIIEEAAVEELKASLDDLAGSIAASRPLGGCGFARLKAQVAERPELGPVRRRAVNLNRRKAVPPMGEITSRPPRDPIAIPTAAC